MRIEERLLDDIRPYENNPRKNAAAERAAAERAAAEPWSLSEREIEIVKSLGRRK